MFLTEQNIERLRVTGIADATTDALVAYIENRRPVGHFLTAVLSNNLNASFTCADDVNIEAIGPLIRWVYNYAPGECWGSKGKVMAWLSKRAV